MRVLVMGGTEFISLHLLRALQRRGHDVTVFNRGRHPDRLPAGVTPRATKLLVANRAVDARRDGDWLEVTVPSILDHEVVAVDFG